MNATEMKLAEAILKHLVEFASGGEAVSFLLKTLQQDGWKGLGNTADFETTCRNLGFIVRKARNSRGQLRTEIAL